MAKAVPRALLSGLAGLGLLLLAGGGTVWRHYRSTPTFREWVRATPVDEAVWRAHAPAGVELGRGPRWRSDDGPARERFGQWRARFTARHGAELLLDLEVEVRVESREVAHGRVRGAPSEAFEGLEAFVTQRGGDPDFHGVAVLTLYGFGAYVEGATPPDVSQGPHMQLDLFALAGPGRVELVVLDADRAATAPLLGGGVFAAPGPLAGLEVLLQMLALEDPPLEGLAYQARATLHPIWTSEGDGGNTGGFGNRDLAATTRLYSAALQVVQAVRAPFDAPDHFSLSLTDDSARGYTWNGAVW